MSHDPMHVLVDAIVVGGVIAALFLAAAGALALLAFGFGFNF
jgi:hypothetical protein